MYLIWLGVILLAGKLFELGPLAGLSWMWVLAPFIVALLWFEVLESALGMDKRKKEKQAESENAKAERIRASFNEPQKQK